MADVEQFNDPKSVAPQSASERRDGDQPASSVGENNGQSASAPTTQSQPPVRRSSLRPAPADYRPSLRDPSTLRPMMVVRAGDAPNEAQDGSWPLVIPPPPAVPIDMVPNTNGHLQPFKDVGALERSANAEAETLSREASAVAATESNPDVPVSSCDTASTSDLGQHEASNATPSPSHTTSKPQSYRFIAYALTGAVLGGAVAALVQGHRYKAATHNVRVRQRVGSTPQQPTSFASSSGAPIADDPIGKAVATVPSHVAPIADDSNGKTAAVEPATAAASAPTSPAASAPPDTTRVTLDIKPIDAKVYYLGRAHPGPPFEFDVAKGQRIAVEVVRFGFVTRKVVIDDKKPVITCGMVPERYRPKPE
jgi:hypothetical protein